MIEVDSTDPHGLAVRVWQALRDLVLDPAGGKAAVAAELGLSFGRARALPRLLDGPLTLRQLAEALTTDPPYATLIVDDLSERGLVVRQPHPQDGRSKLVTLTDAGRTAADRVAQLLSAPPTQLQRLDAADLRALHAILAKLGTGTSQPVLTDGGTCVDALHGASH